MAEASTPPVATPNFQRLVLFDGVCAVCDATVQWILDHDPGGIFHFAPLQGDTAQGVLARNPSIPRQLDSILLVEVQPDGSERVYWHTSAVLRIAAMLGQPWSWLAACRIVPGFLRDPFYRAFASVRYRIFGKLDSCRMPDPEHADRFLD